jgi:restriction system protein
MGYGKFRPDAAVVTKQSSDEGIDGYIDQDPLGLDVVYVQAKRWVNTVTRDELNKFVGSLVGKHTQKGIFVTTSNFTSGALDYASRVGLNIVLVDGDRLTSLMVEHGLGVSTVKTYDVKRIDLGYFAEGE